MSLILIASFLANGVGALGRDGNRKSLYRNETDGKATATAARGNYGYHGDNPYRSAFVTTGQAGTAFYMTDGGYFAHSNLQFLGAMPLYTPFSPNAVPGVAYRNVTNDPTLPQIFWISDDPINSGSYVIAASDGANKWWGLTEDCVRRDLSP
jgi:hypothetical protein